AVEPAHLRAVLAALAGQHDALRLRLAGGGGDVRQWCEPAEPADLLSVVDLAGVDPAAPRARGGAAAARPRTGFGLARGPLLRGGVWLEGPGGRALLLVAHHLAVDTVSWQILLDDLATAVGQAERDLPIHLGPKTTSFKRWSERLAELAGSAELATEADYWLA